MFLFQLKTTLRSILSDFLKGFDRRLKVLFVAIGLQNWSTSLPSQYKQLYATSLGANPIELGSLNSIGSLVNSIISAPIGWVIDRYGVKRMLLLGLSLSAIVSGIYGCAFNWWMLIPAIILTQIGMRLIMPLTDIIIIGSTNPKRRALTMGFSRTIWAIPNIFAPVVAAIIVYNFGGINSQGIRPLYFVQLFLFILTIVIVSIMLKPLPTRLDEKSRSHHESKISFIEDYKTLIKSERWLKHWMIIMSVQRFGMGVSMPFVPLWIVQVKGADPYLLGVLGTLSIVTSLLLQIPMGRLADMIGRKKVYLILCPFVYLGTLLLVLAPDPLTLSIVGILGAIGMVSPGGGGIGGVRFIPFITMYWESVPAEKRGRLQGLTGIFGISGVIASLLGGFLWQNGYRELVLLLPILIEVLILMPILICIPENPQ